MRPKVRSDIVDEVLDILGACDYELPLPSGGGTMVFTKLPGRCVAAAYEDDGHLYVLLDLRKPDAHSHARRMLASWSGRPLGAPGSVVLVKVA